MTESQHKHFYLKWWIPCARANGWQTVAALQTPNSKLQTPNKFVEELKAKVQACAEQLAAREHRGLRPDDFRHACHIVATGKNKSSLQLTNQECDRVVDLFKLLADPDSIQAVQNWEDPEIARKRGLLRAVRLKAPEAYIAAIARDRFHTTVLEDLTIKQLQSLCFTLNQRKGAWRGSRTGRQQDAGGTFQQERQQDAGGTFPKLEYVKKPAAPF
jgi:hypothetical protein